MNYPVHYVVTPANPRAHLFEVVCTVASPDPKGQLFSLPSWIRGSYLVRDFAKHVVDLSANCKGQPVAVTRVDKRTLHCAPCSGPLTLRYRVYAYDESVRKAYLDPRRGFFNGSSLFYCPRGLETSLMSVEIQSAGNDWKLATTLKSQKTNAAGFGTYLASDYEDLLDHPVEMSAFARVDFDVAGIPHAFVFSGRCEPDTARLARDAKKICEVQHAMFGHEPKLDQYLFLTRVVGAGYGGLEHRSSTALICSRNDLPREGVSVVSRDYRGFLGLVSHEYFHLWNVKRITAKAFMDSDLEAEAYSRDLWHYEGITSYYDDLFLLRAGILDAATYLDVLAETATRLERTPGRALHTLADASFETWIKYYQPDENSGNATTNYYVKGALAALCLDLTLRAESTITLDDVMRELWTRYGAKSIGVPEGGLEKIAQELSGLDLRSQLNTWLRSTDELPLIETLARFGVNAERRAATSENDPGGRNSAKPLNVTLGLKLRGTDLGIASVLSGSAAETAGLAAGDVLVALDGYKLTPGNWSNRVASLHPQRDVSIHYFRGDELLTTKIAATAAPLDTWTFALANGDVATQARRKAWLGL